MKEPETESKPTGAVAVETVETDDFSLDYCRFGTGAQSLVILPGISIQSVMGSAEAVADAYQQFTEDYTVYVFDWRKDLPETYSAEEMAEDTAAAMNQLGLSHTSLFGVSYGGMAGMVIAARYPELVDRMILASTSANVTEEQFSTLANWISLAEKGDAKELYLAFGEALYPADVFEQSRQLLIDAAEGVTKEDLKRFVILAEGMRGFNVLDELDQIQCPVLAIGDRQDRVLGPQAMETLIQSMSTQPRFESYLFDGYGHAVYDMAPDFKDRMSEFFKKTFDSAGSQRPEDNPEIMNPRNTYTLDYSAEVNGRQGLCSEGEVYWVSGSASLAKYDRDWNLLTVNEDPFKGYEIKVNHIGDIDVYENELYIGAEYFMDGVGTNIQIAVYDGDTLELKRTFPFDAESGQLECSGIAVDPDTGSVWMCSWVGEESGRYLYRYDLKTGEYLGKVHLQMPPQWLQGIAYHDGWIYMTADDGTADDEEPDHLYRTRIEDGKTSAIVTLERTFDDVTRQGEIEGLTFDKERSQLLVLYNRGAQIVLGMPKGFYEGYDREISEVFAYRIKPRP